MTRGWSAERQSFVQYYGGDGARREQPADAARQVHRPARPAHARHPRGDRARPGVRQPRVPLRPEDRLRRRPRRRRRRARSRSARSGWWSASRAPAASTRRASCSRRCSPTPAASASSPSRSSDTGDALGNYPQAFTHLGLISAAWDLNMALGDGLTAGTGRSGAGGHLPLGQGHQARQRGRRSRRAGRRCGRRRAREAPPARSPRSRRGAAPARHSWITSNFRHEIVTAPSPERVDRGGVGEVRPLARVAGHLRPPRPRPGPCPPTSRGTAPGRGGS